MKLHATLGRVLAAIAVALLALGAAQPTTAAPPSKPCPPDYFCLYDNLGFQGDMKKFRDGANLREYNFPNRAESWINNTGRTVTLTDFHTFRPDQTLTVGVGSNSDMGSWRNRIDKVKVNR